MSSRLENGNSKAVNATTEETPLLAESDGSLTNGAATDRNAIRKDDDGDDDDDDRPLPKLQLVVLCLARVVDPFAFFSIFPFVNQMVKDNGNLDYAEIGFYSGLIESLFSLTQMVVMIFWGRLSDRFGRKPVLVTCLFGVAFTMSAFGLSTTIWQMILFRSLSGIFAGTVVTIRTMFAEISTPKTQARAFSWFAFSGNIGIFLGPLVGGALAEPAKHFPGLFGNIKLFNDFPFFLPTLAIGSIGLTSAILSLLFLKETHVRRPKEDSEADQTPAKAEPMSTWSLLKSPGVPMVLFVYGYVVVLGFAFTSVSPVFWFTPIELGGYGFDAQKISLFMGLGGAAQALWLLFVFPPLQRRYGTGSVLRLCADVWPFFFVVFPIMNLLLRNANPGVWTFFWVFTPTAMVIGTGVSMAFTATQLCINDISPSPQVFGTLNAIALTVSCALRSFSPALFTSIFALGVEHRVLKGHLVWVIMVFLALGNVIATRHLPKKVEGRVQTRSGNTRNS